MRRNRLGPVDAAGITLGVVAALMVIFAIVGISTQLGASWRGWRGAWMGEMGRGGLWQKVEEDQTVPGAFREVEIRGIAGSIEVSGGTGDEVRVHAVRSGTPRALEGIRVDIQKEGDRLMVSEKRESWGMMRPGSIDFSVTLPRGVTSVVAHTVSGRVTVRDVGPGIAQRLESVSGSISTSRAADLLAKTTSGRIDFVFAGRDLEAHSISGSVDGTIDSIGRDGSVRITTISGSVNVDAPQSLDARLVLHSVSGSVTCGYPVTVSLQKRNTLEGAIGAGNVPVEISTTSGSIALQKK